MDEQLKQLKHCKWLPWVGSDYQQLPAGKKLLIVGESHYLDKDKLEKSTLRHSDPGYTRQVVQEIAIDGNKYKTKFYAPLHRCLFGTNKFDRNQFWQNIAFFNLVQSSSGDKKKRPRKSHYLEGWEFFAEALEALGPDKCLMLGTTSASHLKNGLRNTDLKLLEIKKHKKISGALPRLAILVTPSGKKVELHFIKHCSQIFQLEKVGFPSGAADARGAKLASGTVRVSKFECRLMSLPINIEELVHGHTVEWERLEFKKGWNPEDVMHSMCAFANDLNNWGGGYIIIGIDENNGQPVFPPKGLQQDQLDAIQGKIVELGSRIIPNYYPVTQPYVLEGKHVLALWCPAGDNRPYTALTTLGQGGQRQPYVRIGSKSILARGENLRTSARIGCPHSL
ncbi:MAG: ATP-binding protein [Owenweeksia sp.]|nr:ATP-binding protein [Owenweeksia sp.]